MDNADKVFIGIVAILLTITGFIYGVHYQQQKENAILKDYYKTFCVAMPGQTSIMKWIDGAPQCTKIEPLVKHGNNLKDWKNERN